MKPILQSSVSLVWLAVAAAAFGGDVGLVTESDEAYVGVPFAVAIDVTAKDSHDPPEFPDLGNASVQAGGQSTSNQSSFQITINGQRITTESSTTRYLFHITPKEPGALQIPAIPVRVDGETLRTPPRTIRVTKSETGDLMYVELAGSKESVFVGEPIDLTLEIWLRTYEESGVRLDQNYMWQSIDKEASDWGPFLELIQQRRPQVSWRSDQRRGEDGNLGRYFVYQLEKRVWPERVGPIEAEKVRIVATYPLKIARDQGPFSFFADWKVTRTKPISATIAQSPVTVKPIPTEDRPPYFRGAVGPHMIHASAVPTEVRVGDPITLNIFVTGKGRLDLLQAPVLADLPEFRDRFQVSDDQLPGVVEQDRKHFTQTIRALVDDVGEIPAIPLAYFDTQRKEFVTVYSDPIRIRVEAAEKMPVGQIVESGDVPSGAIKSLTVSQHGIEGNYTEADELLARHGFRPATASAVIAAASPLLYVATALVRRSRQKRLSDAALVRRRAARRNALRRLDHAEATGGPAELTIALLGYVADRLDLAAGGLTRAEAVAALKAADTATDAVDELDGVLAECEALQYGGRSPESIEVLARRARGCVDRLERLRP